MALRLLISDALWSKIEPVLRELKHAAGSPPKLSDRMFIEAVLYRARTGTPWRDLPDEFGDWNAVYHRFRRWEKRELWKRLWQRFQSIDDEQLKELFIDSTIVRAHRHAAGASKKTGDNKPRLWAALGAGQPHIKSLSHQYLISEAIVQCRPNTFLPDADLRRLTLQKIDRHMPNHSHIVRCITPTNPTLVFPKRHIQSPVQLILDSPV